MRKKTNFYCLKMCRTVNNLIKETQSFYHFYNDEKSIQKRIIKNV